MTIGLTTRKRLWSHSGRTCAFPGCEQLLLYPVESDIEEVVVGKECHIVAQSDDGPRGPSGLSAADQTKWAHLIAGRDGYANLILLCGVHHDVIDGDPASYPIGDLVAMKQKHELAATELIPPERRRADALEERYAAIVDGWATRVDLDRWEANVSSIVADAAAREEFIEEIPVVSEWLLRRVWPRTLPRLEAALHNYRFVASDLEAVARRYATRRGRYVLIDRVYQEVTGHAAREENLRFLEARSEYFQALAADLAVELTRAVNLICDRVREDLQPDYRIEKGYATIGLGLGTNLSYTTLRPLYPPNVGERPYRGLKAFIRDRATRDWYRGAGLPPTGAGLPGLSREDFEELESAIDSAGSEP